MRVSSLTTQAAGEIDPTFNAAAQSTKISSVRTIVVQRDGRLLVGGQFATANNIQRNGIVRFNANGSVDTSFNPPEFSILNIPLPDSLDSVITYAIAEQSDGKILVGGNFSRVDNQIKPSLVRLNADGSLDSTFIGSTSIGSVFDIKIQSDNRIVVGTSQGVARLNSDGSRDTSLQLNIGGVNSLAIQPDGKIVVGSTINNETVYRVNSDGTTDNTFFPVSIRNVNKIVIQPDGKILLGGSFGAVNGNTSACITRLNSNGSFDGLFNIGRVGANATVNGIEVLPDGKILIGGFFTTYNGVTRSKVARLNYDGSLNQSFNYFPPTSTTYIYAVAATNDGKVYAGGGDDNPNGNSLSRLNTDGSVDTTFLAGVYGRGTVYKVLSQPDGKVLVAGSFNKINGIARQIIARLNADGSVDAGFVPPSFSGIGLTMDLQSDGKIILSKDATSSSPGDDKLIVRLNSNGSLDSSFQPPQMGGRVTEIALQSDGKIVIGGYFSISSNSSFANINLTRLNTDGSEDTSFTRSVTSVNGNTGYIFALKIQPDGKILIGGTFTRVGTAVRNRIARINTNGTLDETFNQPFGVEGDVYDLVLQSNGNIVIGGAFTQVNATPNFRYIARLFPDARLDTSFTPQSDGAVHSLENQPNDKIVVGGLFNYIGGATRINLARLNANGVIDSSFNASGANDLVFSINTSNDGKILIGGRFTRVNGTSSVGVARLLSANTPIRTAYDFDGDGRSDVAVFRPSSGYWFTSQNPAVNYGAVQFGQQGDRLVPADFDGDGRTDFAVFRSGTWYIQRSSLGFTSTQFGAADDVLVPADFDGDGRADIAVFRPSNGTWYLLQSTAGFAAIPLGLGTDKPVPGDYNGDGKAEVAVFRPSNGFWYLSTNPAIGYGGVQFGASEDKPVPADYDGDGRTDLAVFRPSNGTWYLLQSTAGFAGITFGLGTDTPTPADYDGDGKTDLAVFRPSNGTWYLNRTTNGFTGIQFGTSSDLPVPNSFVR